MMNIQCNILRGIKKQGICINGSTNTNPDKQFNWCAKPGMVCIDCPAYPSGAYTTFEDGKVKQNIWWKNRDQKL